jgi:Malate:quinone oxidoreductase (Mqo)
LTLIKKKAIAEPRAFINPCPHMSFVWGEANVKFHRLLRPFDKQGRGSRKPQPRPNERRRNLLIFVTFKIHTRGLTTRDNERELREALPPVDLYAGMSVGAQRRTHFVAGYGSPSREPAAWTLCISVPLGLTTNPN